MLENLDIFFNSEEFAVDAFIRNRAVTGLEARSTILSEDVETQKTTFTCASQHILEIAHGESIRLKDQLYRVVGIYSDGSGLTRLVLERVLRENVNADSY